MHDEDKTYRLFPPSPSDTSGGGAPPYPWSLTDKNTQPRWIQHLGVGLELLALARKSTAADEGRN